MNNFDSPGEIVEFTAADRRRHTTGLGVKIVRCRHRDRHALAHREVQLLHRHRRGLRAEGHDADLDRRGQDLLDDTAEVVHLGRGLPGEYAGRVRDQGHGQTQHLGVRPAGRRRR